MPNIKGMDTLQNENKLESGKRSDAATCWASSCGRVTLYLGDCREVLPELNGVDVVISDPPYGTTAAKWDSVDGLVDVLKNYPSVAFSVEPTASSLRTSLPWRYDWKWIKSKPSGAMFSEHQPMRMIELVMVFGKVKYNPQKRRRSDSELKQLSKRSVNTVGSEITGGAFGRSGNREDNAESFPVDALFYDNVFNRALDKTAHPSQKPVELMGYLVQTHSDEGSTILDPYMGSGTTGIACIRTGRKFIGIEKDPEHYATALNRIQKELAQGDLFL